MSRLKFAFASRSMRIALMAMAAIAYGSVANAGMVFYSSGGGIQPAENVLLPTGQSSQTITGETNQTHVAVTFTQPIAPETLTTPSNGQSRIASADGAFSSLSISLASGYYFTELEANPDFTGANITFRVTAYDPVTNTYQDYISKNGSNYFGVQATNGTLIASVSITVVPDTTLNTIADVAQIRIGGVQQGQITEPTPEPTTAALLAMGAFGFAGNLYRKRRQAS